MNRIRVKICGITRPEDGLAAALAGADAIGLVFYKESPRAVSIDSAKNIISELPPFITKVGLFVDASVDHINTVLSKVNLDLLQFHGMETPADCLRFAKPYIKAIKVQPGINLALEYEKYAKAAGLLLDAFVPGKAGGTGKTFDWSLIPHNLKKKVILAGGLDADNVAEAIRLARPYAVDVSGGVESAPGIKDKGKIISFIKNVRQCSDE